MKVPYLDLTAQYRSLRKEISAALQSVLSSGSYVLGPEVEQFEQEFARYCGSRYCVAVNSGTSALLLSLRALGIRPGAEVITSANTFVATAAAIAHTGARPVLVDVDPVSRNMDPSRIEVTDKTKAVVPVHLYGRPVDWDAVESVALQHDLALIEDSAQAHGAKYNGRPVGSLGEMAAFSFYPAKNLGACGEGGAITTGDESLAGRLRMLRDHGSSEKYRHELLGYNARMDAIQGAILRVKLRHLDEWNRKRKRIASLYNDLLKGLPVVLPEQEVFHVYVIAAERRDELQEYLSENGVPSIIHYPIPIHLQPAFGYLGHKKGDFPVTEELSEQILSLPIYPEMPEEHVEYVGARVREFFERG